MSDDDARPGHATPPQLSPQQREADEADLYAGLNGLTGIVAGAHGVVDLLGAVAEFAALAIPGAEGVSVALVNPQKSAAHIQIFSATADFVPIIDAVQYQTFNEGPCITSMQSGRPTVCGSLGSDNRWPRFGGRVARMGVHSALSLPLLMGDQVMGAINSYAHARDAFGDHAVQLGSQFAGPASMSVYNAQLLATARSRIERLQRALQTRAVIDQAIGIIRSRAGVSADQAFERLAKISQTENVKLYLVAERLVDEAIRRARARQR